MSLFSFFKKKTPPAIEARGDAAQTEALQRPGAAELPPPAAGAAPGLPDANPERGGWLSRLKAGLRKTGQGIAQVFTGTRIDDALYEELESALLMADAGLPATQQLLADL